MIGKEVKDSAVRTQELIIKESVFQETGEKIKLIVLPLYLGSEDAKWTLFMGVSLESVRTARTRLILVSSGSFALALIIFIFISFYLAKRAIKPIKELEKGVGIIGKGNLDYQIEIITGDEIEELGTAFNSMTKNLKKQYLALEGEKNKTLAIINNFADGVLVLDKNNKLLLINPKAETFFKFSGENLIGKPISELSKITTFEPLVKIFEKERKKEFFRQEFKITENLLLEMSTVPVIAGKERSGTLIILHDVTREKLIEKMKNEFVSLTAHQLRTPLSAMKWSMKMLLDEDLGKLNKEQKDFLQDSYESNERMIYLINDLLNVTKIEEGKFIYNLTLTNIKEIAQFVIKSYKKELKSRKLKIELKKPIKALPKVMVDVEKIRMVMENLIDNAVKYSNPDSKIIISLKQVKNEVEFSIKDEGIGIPKKQHPRMFSKFFRGSNVMKMDTEGNGLGLYITKNIIEAHNGKIWFESELDKGSTFYFQLPIKSK